MIMQASTKAGSALALSSDLNLDSLESQYAKHGRIHIPQILTDNSADKIYQSLSTQSQWNLAWNKGDEHVDMDYQTVLGWTKQQRAQLDEIILGLAEKKFQYCYMSVPIYDIYQKDLLPGHFFNQLYEFINSDQVLNLARKVTNFENIDYADIQATRFSRGHFLKEHDDDVQGKNRLAAYVINLTPEWKSDWGGALVFETDGGSNEAYFPKFNAINIFSVPQKHLVSMVSPFATADRYSITGWFRGKA